MISDVLSMPQQLRLPGALRVIGASVGSDVNFLRATICRQRIYTRAFLADKGSINLWALVRDM